MTRLNDHVAIVTGAGQGIGRAVATALAREGAATALVSRTFSRIEDAARLIDADGGKCIPIECDVTDPVGLKAAVERTVADLGAPTILVNNAQSGVEGGAPVPLEDTTAGMVQAALAGGFFPTLEGMQRCFPYMKETGGTIVNMGSPVGVDGDPGFSAYGSNKEAIRGLTRHAAREWGRYGITVNVLCPSALTDSVAEFAKQNPDAFESAVISAPLQRVGDPEHDIAPIVVSFATDLRYVTGATIMADGGRVLLR